MTVLTRSGGSTQPTPLLTHESVVVLNPLLLLCHEQQRIRDTNGWVTRGVSIVAAPAEVGVEQNAVVWHNQDMSYPLLLILILALLGLLLLWLAWHTRQATGLPAGEVIFSDTGAWEQVEKPLISQRYGLIGKPDYLVKVGGKITVPVEVKSRKKPPVLLEYHVLQLGAYCLLVEDQFEQMPPYGLLRYANATVKIDFTEHLRNQVLTAVAAIRRDQERREVRRNHNEPARCAQCGYQQGCGNQRLQK